MVVLDIATVDRSHGTGKWPWKMNLASKGAMIVGKKIPNNDSSKINMSPKKGLFQQGIHLPTIEPLIFRGYVTFQGRSCSRVVCHQDDKEDTFTNPIVPQMQSWVRDGVN